MDGTLVITGPLAELSKIAADIDARYPHGVSAGIAIASYGGWNAETMTQLLRRIGPRQRKLLSLAAEGGGYIPSELLRTEFADERGHVRGLTGPIAKHRSAMIERGQISNQSLQVISATFDAESRNPQRASGMEVPAKLLPVLKAAFRSASL